MYPSYLQVSQSFYQRQDGLNQSFSANPNQSMYSYKKEVNPYKLQSKSFYQSSEQSSDLNNSYSFEFRCDATPVKEDNSHLISKLQYCANKCKDLEHDLKKLKEFTTNEREDFKQKLEKLKRLILEKENTSLVFMEISTQTNMEDLSMIDEQISDNNTYDQMSISNKLREFHGGVKRTLTEYELEPENRENELCSEISKLRNRVESLQIEFRNVRRKTSCVSTKGDKSQELDSKLLLSEISYRTFPLKRQSKAVKISKERHVEYKKDIQIKNKWILGLVLIVLIATAIYDFLL